MEKYTVRKSKLHYFSIKSLLVTEQLVPCTFLQKRNFVGFLESDNGSDEHASDGSVLQLPYWIANCLQVHKTVVVIHLPKSYREYYRDILQADPKIVDMKGLSRFFYDFGNRLCQLDHKEVVEVKTVLLQAFRRRFRIILDWAQNVIPDQEASNRLSELEMEIFTQSKICQIVLDFWMKHGTPVLCATPMILHYKKRKYANFQISI